MAAEILVAAYQQGGKVLFCGNGGSAADSQHLATELVGRYRGERQPLAAIALTTDTSALTAIANDYDFNDVFARQVLAVGNPGDVLVALSTSGTSPNVLNAVATAKERGLTIIAFSGRDGGPLAQQADIALTIPAETSDRVQEVHITLGHVLCGLVEGALFPESVEPARHLHISRRTTRGTETN
jgi:D-sedoheptulose 7-phosphate isomerase